MFWFSFKLTKTVNKSLIYVYIIESVLWKQIEIIICVLKRYLVTDAFVNDISIKIYRLLLAKKLACFLPLYSNRGSLQANYINISKN